MSQHAISPTELLPPAGNGSGQQADDHARVLVLLDERLRFDSLLARLSATFINLPAEKVDSQIEQGLRQIVEFLGIERCGLGQCSGNGRQLLTTHSYPAAVTRNPGNWTKVQ